MKTIPQEMTDAVNKSAIGAIGVTYSFLGMSMSDLAAVLTAAYMGAQLVYFLYLRWKEWRGKK